MRQSYLHDVIIIGAGVGGSAAGYYLAKQGLDVLLLDKAEFPRDKTCGDGLTPRALEVLKEMELLDPLHQVGYRANGLKIVAPQGHGVEAPFPGSNGLPDYSLIVPRLILDDTIRRHALAAGAAFEGPFRVTEVVPGPAEVAITGKYRRVTTSPRSEGNEGGWRSGGNEEGRNSSQERSVTLTARLVLIATGGASIPLLLRMGLLKRTPPVAVAVRTYFEKVEGLTDQIQLRFDGVPLPGYGWVFPLPNGSANIGAGVFPGWWGWQRTANTARAAYEAFIQGPALQAMLKEARQSGPVKGYPLRIDFPTAPTYGQRVLLVGEAAGLVNPLTGEGIDYALESGKLAAEQVIRLFNEGDFSLSALAGYDRLLRHRFQRLFIVCNWVRDLLVNPLLLNSVIRTAGRRPDLKMLLINIVFGQADLHHLTPRRIVSSALKLSKGGKRS